MSSQEPKQIGALRQSDARLWTLLESMADFVYVADFDEAGRAVHGVFGPGCAAVTGWTPEQLKARPDLWAAAGQEDRPAVTEMMRQLLGGSSPGPIVHRIVHKDGQTRWILHLAAPRTDEQGRVVGYDAMVRDVTDWQRRQTNLVQAAKMGAIVRLAGGVAHDFRNQLTVIKGFAEILERMSLVSGEGASMLKEILGAAGKAEHVTNDLLAFSRKGMLNAEVVDLSRQVAEVFESLADLSGQGIELSYLPEGRPLAVRVDPSQLRQALRNIVENSRDAMPDGGQLRIATHLADSEDQVVRRNPDVGPGPVAILEVSDTGAGMDSQTLSNMFEPFFTTKPNGEATDMGLAMVYGFVNQSGGAVDVTSEPGRGTTVRLLLPVADAG